jgi:hypothetical protein
VVLGDVVAPDAGAIVGFDELEPIGVKLPERHAGIIHVVEHAEFHGGLLGILYVSGRIWKAAMEGDPPRACRCQA